nr:MAG TPA: hypothetical protein [Caudoviricetes sp.]
MLCYGGGYHEHGNEIDYSEMAAPRVQHRTSWSPNFCRKRRPSRPALCGKRLGHYRRGREDGGHRLIFPYITIIEGVSKAFLSTPPFDRSRLPPIQPL